MPPFDPKALARSPIHCEIGELVARNGWETWPSDDQLNELLSGTRNAAGKPLRFVATRNAGHDGAAAYESSIHATGNIPIRPGDWHDLFNAAMWVLYPATKAALNAVHVEELKRGGAQRTPRRDAITLLDECGVLLPVSESGLTQRHAAHAWRDFFVAQRSAWGRCIEPMIIGHGLCEQCLDPYVGLTAKALHIDVSQDWFARSPHERRRTLDDALAAAIRDRDALMSTRELLPLPVLGVPGWCEANRDAAFYDDTAYFRPRRQQSWF